MGVLTLQIATANEFLLIILITSSILVTEISVFSIKHFALMKLLYK